MHEISNEDDNFLFCFWENDSFVATDSELSASNHGMTLKEAKNNYLKFGACEKAMLCHVRLPKDNKKGKGEKNSASEGLGDLWDIMMEK